MTAVAGTDLLTRADGLRAGRVPFVLATVVRAERPTSAKAGDRALVLADGTIEGFVGGSCAESTVRVQGLRLLDSGESTLLRITPAAGESEVAVEGSVTVGNPCLSGGTLEIFLQAMLPPALVYVFGDAPVARALVSVGAAAGYEVRATGDPDQQLPPDTAAVVVASHGRDEEAVLTAAVRAGMPYVGLVASRRRGGAVLAGLDLTDEEKARVHTPAGLDLGARTAAEIALSIYAEIVASRPRAAAAPPPRPPAEAGLAEPGLAEAGLAEPGLAEPGLAEPGLAEPGPAEPAPAEPGPAEAGQAEPGLAEGAAAVDPVCGMTVAVAAASLRLQHADRTWFFCGSGCRRAFADDPDRYAGQQPTG